jgi:octaprenyl-diphosphate synthase
MILSTSSSVRTPSKLDLRKHFKIVQSHLDQVEDQIRAQAASFDPAIVGYVDYALDSQGKRIRPALALLAGKATGAVTPGHLNLAVVVEMIHLATLVHDDIMDGAAKRRGQPTAYAKWGAELSVLLGDCLFSHALMLCTHFPTTDVSRVIAAAANEVCSGEILQTQRRFDLQLSVEDYTRIISMKTGALFRVSTELGGQLNEVPADQIEALRVYGDHLGVAYQIYDDCLDLVGTEGSSGKTLGTDLQKGKLTLPLLHVLGKVSPAVQSEISEIILHGTNEARAKLAQVIRQEGGIEHSVREIHQYVDRAVEGLNVLPKSEYRDTLQAVPMGLSRHVDEMS